MVSKEQGGSPRRAPIARETRGDEAEREALAWVSRQIAAGRRIFAVAPDGRPMAMSRRIATSLETRTEKCEIRRAKRIARGRNPSRERLADVLRGIAKGQLAGCNS